MDRREPGLRSTTGLREAFAGSDARVAELERLNAELLEILSVAAHDLKEPLRNLRACAERLARAHGEELGLEAGALLESVLSGAQRNEQLVDDLLLYTRVLGGPVRLEPLSLEEPLQWALSNLRARIEQERARVTHGPLPSVHADRARMIQLFQNLISNALTYRGEEPARVHVSARTGDREWVLSVQDAGIGVAPADRERIFEPFARLHPADRYPGTGLGLAICRGIVETHGGEMWVEPGPDGGSSFLFTLPAERAAAGGRGGGLRDS